ncbi:hypothetical protein [Methylobacterium nonmethylotrophicum]|uniref:Secreted protein n=1 Tax=Methylobacterium nonmethylotrophicum TaxID=1141884 RepID=A0A4Z0NVP4_9HYPH|nr:hypothetical protein [Methylobacterium nonmethylotrophicum]TGE01752.1 hypothetical protein EU555_03510 [Methylobacterium nonmethylotrophicum]
MLRRIPSVALFAATLLGPAGAAQAGPATDVPRLLRDWTAQNGTCRGGSGDDPATLAACERRDVLHQRLTAAGWCYGRPGDAGYQRVWRPCTGTGR